MAETPQDQRPANEELEQQPDDELPDREAMSLENASLAAPVNVAAALNALSDGSTAVNDEETGDIDASPGPEITRP